jgi:hypothetical protein
MRQKGRVNPGFDAILSFQDKPQRDREIDGMYQYRAFVKGGVNTCVTR